MCLNRPTWPVRSLYGPKSYSTVVRHTPISLQYKTCFRSLQFFSYHAHTIKYLTKVSSYSTGTGTVILDLQVQDGKSPKLQYGKSLIFVVTLLRMLRICKTINEQA